MDKEKYFISIGPGEISRIPFQNNTDFTIYATEDEVSELRRIFDRMHDSNFETYIRSHIPFLPYHNDTANDSYDDALTEVFQTLYKLGDEQTKHHIRTMNILGDKHL